MLVRKFEAVNMKEALSRVKTEMGKTAVILSHREIKKGGGAFGLFARPVVEVTAALDEGATEKGAEERREIEYENIGRPMKRNARNAAASPQWDTDRKMESIISALDPLRDEIRDLKELIAASTSAGALGRSELQKAANLADDLMEIKSLASFMLEESDFLKGAKLDPNFLVCYRRMVERGIEPEFALKLVHEVKESIPGGREPDIKHIVSHVIEKIGEAMITGDPITPLGGGPRVVSLIGPTGVGKTTTLAKIAAELTLKGGRVGLITIDTYRIAAIEQLKIYAEILNIPIKVVLTPDDFADALKAFGEKDVVLIDTAGRSQRDSKKLDELAAFLGEDELIENYLVLSAASDAKTLDEAAKNFGVAPISGLIFTKLDEAAQPGNVINLNLKTGLPLIYCTTGQKVPEDIEKASPEKLATRIFKSEA